MDEYSSLLKESRILAKRHLSEEEKDNFAKAVKEAISLGNFNISQRKENIDYIFGRGLNPQQAIILTQKFFNKDSIKAVVIDNNDPSKELWICQLEISTKPQKSYVYLKLKEEGDNITAISFHDITENIYVSYDQASDYKDGTFAKSVLDSWVLNYKEKCKSKKTFNKIISYKRTKDPKTNIFDRLEITFLYPISPSDFNTFFKAIPRDFGLDIPTIKSNSKIRYKVLKIKLFTKSYLQ